MNYELTTKHWMGNSVTVARLTLNQLVEVQILVPQWFLSNITNVYMLFVVVLGIKEEKEYEVSYHYISR